MSKHEQHFKVRNMLDDDRELIDQLAWWAFECGFATFEEFLADMRWGWAHEPELLARMETIAVHAWNWGQYRWAEYVWAVRQGAFA